MMTNIITLILGNLNLVLFIVAFIVAGIYSKRDKTHYSFELLRWVLFLSGGILGIYTFIMHVFFSAFTSASIGWAPSPFEYEVGMANLAIGMTCLFTLRACYSYKLAAGITMFFWLGGDAVGHVIQMVKTHDFAPGNAGSWFWTDILVPLTLVTTLMRSKTKNS